MELAYVIAFLVYSAALAAFCLWRGKEIQKKRPEVFSKIRETVLDIKADVIARAENFEVELKKAAADIRLRAEQEIAELQQKARDKLAQR